MNSCWVCVNGDGDEFTFGSMPDKVILNSKLRFYTTCYAQGNSYGDRLARGTIKNLIGKDMVFDDAPIRTTFSEVRTAEWKVFNQ